MPDKAPGSKSSGRVKIVLVVALAGLGVYLYLKHRASSGAASAQSPTVAASTGGVPTYSAAAATMYNGAYTPYTIINANPTNMTSTFPGATSVATGGGGFVKSVNNANGGGITNTTTVTKAS